MNAIRAGLALFILMVAGVVHALVPAGNDYYINTAAGYFSTPAAACVGNMAQFWTDPVVRARWTYSSVSGSDATQWTCRFDGNANTGYGVYTPSVNKRSGVCPANSTAVAGGCQCAANFDESGGQCEPHTNQCTSKEGKVGILSWTEGYTRTPDEGDRGAVGPIVSPPASGEVCDSGCAVSIQRSGPGVQPYVSQSPTANGLYRRSVDYPSLGLGKECTAGAADVGAKKDAPPPECPGSVGDLGNGKPVCVGTAAKPVTPTPLGSPPGAAAIAGNPPAGAKPPTGEGSGSGSAGRTPATGDGGAGGGPAGAAVGGKGGGAGGTAAGVGSGGGGGGSTEDPKTCGLPGEPICNVKVDETGTPGSGANEYASAITKMNETKGKDDEQLAKAAGTADKGFFEPVRGLFWAPPVAACETFQLPQQVASLSLNPCGVVDGVRMAMAIVWAGAGLFACLAMIKRSF